MAVLTMAEPKMDELRESAAMLPIYKRAGPVFVSGDGCRLTAENGREYLDLGAGIAVNALGYGDPAIKTAVHGAIDTGLIHTSNLYRTLPGERLADALVENSFADRVFFCNSGAESNEAALKFARRWARAEAGEAKHEFVALQGSFHGRLFGSVALTDRPGYRAPFTPVMPGAHIVPRDITKVAAVLDTDRTAALIVEPVQGEGGVVPLDPTFLAELRALATERNVLLIFDEVQCGLGRTGHLFAYEASGVIPDMMTLAKPLAGGLPMGATLMTERVASTIQPGDHATTFGGGPLVASVALAVFTRVSDPALLENVRARATQIQETVTGWASPKVTAVRGAGLMWGIELNEPAGPAMGRALEAGVLVLTAGEKVIRLLPPLVISEDDLAEGLEVLKGALQ
jgi:predicted acetylornithine/succinylornithine family transaminase